MLTVLSSNKTMTIPSSKALLDGERAKLYANRDGNGTVRKLAKLIHRSNTDVRIPIEHDEIHMHGRKRGLKTILPTELVAKFKSCCQKGFFPPYMYRVKSQSMFQGLLFERQLGMQNIWFGKECGNVFWRLVWIIKTYWCGLSTKWYVF